MEACDRGLFPSGRVCGASPLGVDGLRGEDTSPYSEPNETFGTKLRVDMFARVGCDVKGYRE